MKQPKVGDTIQHRESAFNREFTGKVTMILNAQFVYVTKGIARFCLFGEDWTVIKKGKVRRPK